MPGTVSQMSDKHPTIFLSAAEASGDRHGAKLIRAIRRRLPQARILGAAGPLMAAEGCEVVADLTAQASMVGGPFLKLGYYYRMVRHLKAAIAQAKPDVVVPVDSPALNWHLCKAAKAVGAKVMYYIAPQVWAWAPWRIKKVRRLTDAVACILPFEEEYFRRRGVNATFVGHPLFDDAPPRQADNDILGAWGEGTWQIAVVPGSRRGEVAAHMPALLPVIASLGQRYPAARFVLTAHDDATAAIIRAACAKHGVPVTAWSGSEDAASPQSAGEKSRVCLSVGQTPDVLTSSHFGLIKSGTVTLEAAYFGLPMVIFYKTGPIMTTLHRLVGRCRPLVPTPYLSLVNILARQELVTELMPWRGGPRRLEAAACDMMSDLGHLCELRQGLQELVSPLLPHDGQQACERAAAMVADLVGQQG